MGLRGIRNKIRIARKSIKAKLIKGLKKVYRLFKRQPKLKFEYSKYYQQETINDRLVLFESFHGATISDSPLAILEELVSSGEAENYEIFYSTNDKDYKTHLSFVKEKKLPVKLVSIDSYEYVKILATAKYLINNSSFPAYFIRKKDQIYLQTWHGTPLKTLGKKMRMGIESMYNVQHNFLQASYILFPNQFTKECIMNDYNLNELYTGKIFMCGYPRNSVFLDEKTAESIRKKYDLDNKTVYAYMPTWRGKSNHDIHISDYSKDVQEKLLYIDNHLKDNQVLYVNFHPILKGAVTLDDYKHIKPFPSDVGNYEFLCCTDALITDYSSVFFDYSIMRKPIALFTYDYDEYMKDRGMYFDIKELPFYQTESLNDLTKVLSSEKIKEYTYSGTEYEAKFLSYDTKDNSKKVVDLIFHGIESGLEMEDFSKNTIPERRIIHAKAVSTSELETITQNSQQNDIVLFRKNQFTPSKSALLFDNYNDNFQYVINTKTNPITYLEWIQNELRHNVPSDLQEKRELQRSFPNLNIIDSKVTNYYSDEINCKMRKNILGHIESDVELKTNGLSIHIPVEKYTIQSIFVIKEKYVVVFKRDATLQEQQTGIFYEDYENLNFASSSEICYLCAKVLNKETDEICYGYLANDMEFVSAIEDAQKIYCFIPENSKEERTIFLERRKVKGVPVYTFHKMLSKKVGTYFGKANIIRVHADKKYMSLDILLKLSSHIEIEKICLKHRNAIPNYIDIPYEYNPETSVMSLRINCTELSLKPIFWDLVILCNVDNTQLEIPVHYSSKKWKLRYYLTNRQYRINDNQLIFPYYTVGSNFAFTVKDYTEYDSYTTIIKEIFVVFIYLLSTIFYRKRNKWIVYEKFCSLAQDNGYYFFKYCMENLPEEEKKNILYIIDKNSPDYEKVKMYGKNVIQFMSFKHLYHALTAKILISSDSKYHLYLWRGKPSLIRNLLNDNRILFLQHGVTALKKDHKLFGKKGSNPMTYFITTSEFEQDIIVNNFGYKRANVPVTGFSRWDVLEDHSTSNKVLIMPTWRSWLEDASDEDFRNSDYFKAYTSFMQNKELEQLLEKNNVEMLFYIHPKFSDYINEFGIKSSHIQIISQGSKPLNEIMMDCKGMITDYSSVCWDMYYQKKPVIFYQFDYEMYDYAHGSYIDMENELFGVRVLDETSLVNAVSDMIINHFALTPKDSEQFSYYFTYVDNDNSKRIYQFLKNKGF